MKAKELAELLLKNPDFDVRLIIPETCPKCGFFDYTSYNITGIADIGYSERVIILNEERVK